MLFILSCCVQTEQETVCLQISAVQAGVVLATADCCRNLFHSVARVAWHRGHL